MRAWHRQRSREQGTNDLCIRKGREIEPGERECVWGSHEGNKQGILTRLYDILKSKVKAVTLYLNETHGKRGCISESPFQVIC